MLRERAPRLVLASVLALACGPALETGPSVSLANLDVGVGDSAAYTVEIRCSTNIWGPEMVKTDTALVSFHITETGDIGHSITGLVRDGEAGVIYLEVSSRGKVMDARAEDLPRWWMDAVWAGLILPSLPLPPEPVDRGQSWETGFFKGRGKYTYRGMGFLEGKRGYILEFDVSSRRQDGECVVAIHGKGKAALQPETGLVQAITGRATILITSRVGSFSESLVCRLRRR